MPEHGSYVTTSVHDALLMVLRGHEVMSKERLRRWPVNAFMMAVGSL